ncbi:hypothetical protein FIBSPDRAFT_898837 [Athelia psychrophila]|uniref:Uncharacterized protein n=1 Tax=Athelia psychrophila TaxID=1759441 RepID=A0A166AKV3_9AGAM|nr:hypothetical protein FIBSPDRAFT_898837 [Fibularhizoctonia sp. CBS 109695]
MSAHHIDDYTESLGTPSPTWSPSDPIQVGESRYGFECNNQLQAYYEEFGYPEPDSEGLAGWGGSTSEQNSQVGVEEVATSAMEPPSIHAPTDMQPPISITINDKGVQYQAYSKQSHQYAEKGVQTDLHSYQG